MPGGFGQPSTSQDSRGAYGLYGYVLSKFLAQGGLTRDDCREPESPIKPDAVAPVGAAMRRFRWVRGIGVLRFAGVLLGADPGGVSAVPARSRCRPTVFVVNNRSETVSTIDIRSGTKHADDIPIGAFPVSLAVTPDGKNVFVTNVGSDSVSMIDIKSPVSLLEALANC